jgi:DNA mismatch repair protein MutL
MDPAVKPRDDRASPRDDTVLFQEKKDSPFDQAKYLGQFSNCYLILEMNSELWLIDQHAFHERILFEEFTRSHKENTIARQSMLTPLLISVDPDSFSKACDYQEKILATGFEIEILKNNQIALHSYPAFLNIEKVTHIFEEMLSKFVLNEDAFHLVFATMACHSAVRAGDPLNEELALRLLKRAGDVDFYAHCPHGRPVIRKFSLKDVESWFQRI